MKKLVSLCLFTLVIVFVFSTVLPAIAVDPGTKAQTMLLEVGGAAEMETYSLPLIVGIIINVALSLIGIIMVVLIIYGGFLWMTARGEEKQVTKAKDVLTAAIIGLIIVLSAYAIARFVIAKLLGATIGTTVE